MNVRLMRVVGGPPDDAGERASPHAFARAPPCVHDFVSRNGDDPDQSRFGEAAIRSPGPSVVNLLTVLVTPSLFPLLSSEVTL